MAADARNAVPAILRRQRQLLAAQRGDGIAGAEALPNPLEARARQEALVKADADQRIHVLVVGRRMVGESLPDRLQFADDAIVMKRRSEVVLAEIELADLTAGGTDGVL